MTTSEGESFMEKLSSFLNYAFHVGKLSVNYTIYGERQVTKDVSSPGDVLFELISSHPNFGSTGNFKK